MGGGKTVRRGPDWLALGVSLFLGAACVLLLREVYLRLAAPQLHLALQTLEEGGERRLAVRLVNAGRRELRLDLSDLEYFAYIPDLERPEYWVRIRPAAGRGAPGEPGREGGEILAAKILAAKISAQAAGPVVLRPGEGVAVGNLFPLLRGLPPGEALLRAVYTAEADPGSRPEGWRGVALSLPAVLRLTKD